MEIGIASVATALGESTIPEILPSHGQHESNRYACSHPFSLLSVSSFYFINVLIMINHYLFF